MKRYAALIAVLAAGVLTASAAGGITDPRKCSAGAPAGTHHAYWCAHNAADAAVQTRMKAIRHTRFWPHAYCTQNISLLSWKCVTILGGDQWLVTVTWRATSAGWTRRIAVVKTR